MSKDSLLVAVQVTAIQPRKDRSWKFTFETARELNGEEVSLLVDHFQGEGWLQFSPNEVMEAPPDAPADAGVKSPATRLRGHLYKLWEQRGKKGSFDSFYGTYIEKLTEQIREQLDGGTS